VLCPKHPEAFLKLQQAHDRDYKALRLRLLSCNTYLH
jgi:hypothetical protein